MQMPVLHPVLHGLRVSGSKHSRHVRQGYTGVHSSPARPPGDCDGDGVPTGAGGLLPGTCGESEGLGVIGIGDGRGLELRLGPGDRGGGEDGGDGLGGLDVEGFGVLERDEGGRREVEGPGLDGLGGRDAFGLGDLGGGLGGAG